MLDQERLTKGFFRTRTGIVLIAFLAIAGFLLVFEHRMHVPGGEIWLIILLIGGCIFMHLFMHGSHGGHTNHVEHRKPRDREE